MTFVTPSLLALIFGFASSAILGPRIIPLLRKLKIGQSIREDGPASHLSKSGTPTMGGIIFITGFLIALIISGIVNSKILAIVISTLGFGLVGYLDDYIKVVKKRNLGLRAYQKILGQAAVTAFLIFYYMNYIHTDSHIIVPFLKTSINLGILTVPFLVFVIVGTVNAVNLTDGLDGLATGLSIIVFSAFAYITYKAGYTDISGATLGLVGALAGFLIYNYNPARIFMGDTGSLALGGALSAIAVISGTPLFIPIIGGIFFAETLSVMIQVGYFKLTKKRFFRMAPLHHHYEQKGWREIKVVYVFWGVTLVLGIIGVLAY